MEPHSFPILESGVFLFSDPSQSSLHSPHKDIDAKSGRTGTRIAPPGGGECTGGGQRDRADGSCGGRRKLCVPRLFCLQESLLGQMPNWSERIHPAEWHQGERHVEQMHSGESWEEGQIPLQGSAHSPPPQKHNRALSTSSSSSQNHPTWAEVGSRWARRERGTDVDPSHAGSLKGSWKLPQRLLYQHEPQGGSHSPGDRRRHQLGE